MSMKTSVTDIDLFAFVKDRVNPPGTMVKYTRPDGRKLMGLVIAQRPPPPRGALPVHLIVWSDGSMSRHIYCERMF